LATRSGAAKLIAVRSHSATEQPVANQVEATMANSDFPGPTPEGQFPGPLPRDPYPSHSPPGSFAQHEWMPWALAELSVELDAVSALLTLRSHLQDDPIHEEETEARLLHRAIDQVVGRTSRINWSLLVDFLAALERRLHEIPAPDEAKREPLVAALRTAMTTSEKAGER
jgi:hypothetical protein